MGLWGQGVEGAGAGFVLSWLLGWGCELELLGDAELLGVLWPDLDVGASGCPTGHKVLTALMASLGAFRAGDVVGGLELSSMHHIYYRYTEPVHRIAKHCHVSLAGWGGKCLT